jgi:hypothetical protein
VFTGPLEVRMTFDSATRARISALYDADLAAVLGCEVDSPEFDAKLLELARAAARPSAAGRRPMFEALDWLRRRRA